MVIETPKTVEANLLHRADTFNNCMRSLEAQDLMRQYCKQDILYFFNTWLWAEDPFVEKGLRHGIASERIRPIVTYPFQDEFILSLKEAIAKGEHFIRDKSRDMLATYMVLGVYLHGFLFLRQKFVITSWKEDEVDGKNDTSTHFGKLRFNLRLLPQFLLPLGWDWKRDSSSMKLQNPESGATLTGSAASAGLSSGRREDSIFLDELSKWDKYSSEAWTSASDATPCKVSIWTPRGSGNLAAELMRGTEVKNKGHLLWYVHPEKTFTSEEHLSLVRRGEVFDKVRKYVVQIGKGTAPAGCYLDQYGRIRSEWYDRECENRKPDDIAENMDCDYLTTGRPIFDTSICSLRKKEAQPPKFVGDLNWVVRPIFDSFGTCINRGNLAVEFVPNSNGLYSIWEKPVDEFDNAYLIGADTAEGLEQGDFDVAYVFARYKTKPSIAAKMRQHLKMHEYAEELAKLGTYFRTAPIAVERNNHGHAVIQQLVRIYQNILGRDVFTKGYAESSDRLGFETSSMSKPIIIGTLGKAIAENSFQCDDEVFWGECLTFVEDDGRMEAQGKHRGERCYDDSVMAMAITLWAHLEAQLPSRKRKEEPLPSWVRNKPSRYSGRLVGWTVPRTAHA